MPNAKDISRGQRAEQLAAVGLLAVVMSPTPADGARSRVPVEAVS